MSPSGGNVAVRQESYAFFRVRKIPKIVATRASGASLTNSHSNTWKAAPNTAVSGSVKSQPR